MVNKLIFENCSRCGSNDWKTHPIQSEIKCKECGFETEADHVRKSPSEILTELISDEPRGLDEENRDYSEDLQNRVNDKKTEGWEVLEYNQDHVVMGKQKEAGLLRHFVMFLFTAPLTLGIGNAAYHEYKKQQYEKKVLREKERSEENPSQALKSLNELHQDGLISDEEYESKRKDILERL